MLSVNKKRLWLIAEFLLLFALVAVDQWTKWRFQMWDMVVMNEGGVLGIYPDFLWLWILLVVWLGLFFHWFNHQKNMYRFGLLLILAGGLGNLMDRMYFGFVRDFIHYPMLGFYGNAADIFLFLGVIVCIVQGLLLQYKPWTQTPQE